MAVPSLIPALKIVEGLAPSADPAGRTGRYASLAGVSKATILVHINQGDAAAVQLTINQATSTSGANAKPITELVPIWANQDAANTDGLTKQTAGTSFTTSSATTHKVVAFDIDPASLDCNNGFLAIAIVTGASNSANITQANYLLSMRDSSL